MVPRDRIELPTRGFYVPQIHFSQNITKPHKKHIKTLLSLCLIDILPSHEIIRLHTA
jgi:hypothetical protein